MEEFPEVGEVAPERGNTIRARRSGSFDCGNLVTSIGTAK